MVVKAIAKAGRHAGETAGAIKKKKITAIQNQYK